MKKIIYIIIVEIKGAAVLTGKLGNLLDGDFFYRFLRVERPESDPQIIFGLFCDMGLLFHENLPV